MKDDIRQRFDEAAMTIRMTEEHLTSRIAQAAEMIIDAYRDEHGVFAFGNGGSALDAQHIALELVGRFLQNRRALRAQALTAAGGLLTCLGNDLGSEAVFSRQLEANADAGDIAIGLSTSGNSSNVVAGLETARRLGMKTIAMTGSGGGECAPLADILLDVPSSKTPRIQEAHVVIYHILCEFIEAHFAAPPAEDSG